MTVAGGVLEHDATDLFGLTAALVAVPSESHHEAELAAIVRERLAARAPSLAVDSVGASLVARTHLGRDRRVVLGGHLDTVPANGNETPRIDGDVLHGLGSADMKGGLAVLLRLAEELEAHHDRARHDVTLAFYECEEVADRHNGLRRIFDTSPDLLAGRLRGAPRADRRVGRGGLPGRPRAPGALRRRARAPARPWMGRNAIHRATEVLQRLASHEMGVVDVDGLEYRESLQVVRVDGGIEGKYNVVPDSCTLVVGRRFAPCYTIDDAEEQVRALLDRRRRGGGAPGPAGGGAEPHQPARRRVRRGAGAARPAEARLDRRGAFRVARRTRGELRAGRPRDRAHRGRARRRATRSSGVLATLAALRGRQLELQRRRRR